MMLVMMMESFFKSYDDYASDGKSLMMMNDARELQT
jgi:hypothetical protein